MGTIHRSHLTESAYPLSYLAGLIETYRPDLILVEVRPEPFALGHLEDGPFEMTYVTRVRSRSTRPRARRCRRRSSGSGAKAPHG